MTTRRKTAAVARHAVASSDPVPADGSVAGPDAPLNDPWGPVEPRARRRHLEGFAYYFVIVPCWIVASIAVLVFVDAVERYIYGDD